MKFKPLSYFLRNGKIVRKVDYGNYVAYHILIGNSKVVLVECKDNQCIEIRSYDLTEIKKKK